MFASHFVAQTILLGDALLPQSPCKPGQNVAVLSQKRDWKCVHFGLFFWQDQAVFFVVGVGKKWPFMHCLFSVVGPKKDKLIT